MSQGQEICEHWAYLPWTWFQFHGFLMIFGEAPTARFLAPKSRSSCTSQCRSRIVKMSWCGFLPTSLSMALMKNLRSEKKKKKQHLSSIIIREPSSASSLEKLEISYARDLILNSWKIKGLHARWISEHLCTLRDGALDQARHMWPQGRVQPTEQTAQRPIHHTTRRNQLPLKTKRW